MATPDGRRVNRPYRKASEYLATKQSPYNGPKTIVALEAENLELREKLTTSVRRLETMEVEFEQSREYFATQLDVVQDKLNRTTQALKLMQQSYSELQSINYELEQRVLKVNHLEDEKSQLTTDVHELTNRLTETRSALQRTQKENERLRKDCNLAVSLLECNAGNFKQQKAEQLPRELQNHVEEYQMDLTQYNEYINPYADDSDSETENEQRYYHAQPSTVPTELLANVLKKPENVHLNLQDTDFIKDPHLNSVYKGQIAEKRLVKYDYQESPSHHQNMPNHESSMKRNEPQFKLMPRSSNGAQSSSPWELATTSTTSTVATSSGSSSPWEMSSNPPARNDYDADDYSAASAYGAYPVSYRKSNQRQRSNLPKKSPLPNDKKSSYTKTKMSSSYNAATAVRKQSQKGTGENKDVYISDMYKQLDGDKEDIRSTPSSGRSSQKSTPAHEKGSSAEKSSLLDEGDSEDDLVLTVEIGGERAPKVGMGKSPKHGIGEERGLLNDSDPEPDVRELDYEEEEKSKVRESDEENMREPDVRESVEHEEIDLLNLDENTQVLSSTENSPLHQIMMQQSILSSALLPDLPPPSDQQYDGELLLVGEAPPPPDMFGGAPTSNLGVQYDVTIPTQSILQNPLSDPKELNSVMSQSFPMISQSTTVMSQSSTMPCTRSSNSLDDLKSYVQKEFNEATSSTPTSPKDALVTPSVQDDLFLSSGSSVPDELSGATSGTVDIPAGILQVESSGNSEIQLSVPDEESESEEIAEKDEPLNEEPGSTGKNEMDEISEKEGQDSDENENQVTFEMHENVELMNKPENFTEKEETGNSAETFEAHGQSLDCEVTITTAQQENLRSSSADELLHEPLEVLELQEEPRGGGASNRRRRNSFDQAREFGNVMDV
uniref:uncharacterized protein LOC120331452 n=1 Tax=Styela clava TaxID=7725 RepID=UPI00193A5E8D|nr:uncharacterized protein LOC120331452 [Styela clava]